MVQHATGTACGCVVTTVAISSPFSPSDSWQLLRCPCCMQLLQHPRQTPALPPLTPRRPAHPRITLLSPQNHLSTPLSLHIQATHLHIQATRLHIQATRLHIQATHLRIQATRLRIQATPLRIQTTRPRIQAIPLRIQATRLHPTTTGHHQRHLIGWATMALMELLGITPCSLL